MANSRIILNNVLHGKSVTPSGAASVTNSDPNDIYTAGASSIVIAANESMQAVVIHRTTRTGTWNASVSMGGRTLSLAGASGTDTLVGVLPGVSSVSNITIASLNGQKIDMVVGGTFWSPDVNFTLGSRTGLNLNNQFQSSESGVLYARHVPFQRFVSANWNHLTFSEASEFYDGVFNAMQNESVTFVDLYPSESQQERSRLLGWIREASGPTRAPRGEMSAGLNILEATPLAEAISTVTLPVAVTTDTDEIFIRGTTTPATPSGGTSNENNLPTGWSRTNPGATETQNVYRSQRRRTYRNGIFSTAGAWGAPEKVADATGVIDDTPPAYVNSAMSTDGHYLTVTYNEALDTDHIPEQDDFDILEDSTRKNGGTHPNPTGTSVYRIVGATMEHYFTTAIGNSSTVTIQYTNPGDTTALQDAAGNEVASYGPNNVTQPTLLPVAAAPSVTITAVAAGTEGTEVVLGATLGNDGTFDGAVEYVWQVSGGTLDSSTSATPTWTRPQVNAGTDFDIDLQITVNGTGTNARNGTSDTADAPQISATVNDTGDTTAPTFVSAAMDSTGNYLTVTYSEALDTAHIPEREDFSVLANGGRKGGAEHPSPTGTSAFRLDGATMEHYYSTAIPADQTVTIQYTNPGDASALQDAAGNEVASYGPNNVTQPTQLPVAAAPTVTISAVAAGDEETTVVLGATLGNDGTYDGAVTYAWTVSGGTLNDATSATPTWTRPAVNANTDFDIDLQITVNGTGTNARNGTSDTADAPQVNATVNNVVVLAAPGTPTSLADTATTANSVTWEWSAPSTGGAVATYEYRTALSSGTFSGAWTTVGTDTSVTVSSLTTNTEYKIQVRARNATGVSATPAEDTATPTAARATNSQTISLLASDWSEFGYVARNAGFRRWNLASPVAIDNALKEDPTDNRVFADLLIYGDGDILLRIYTASNNNTAGDLSTFFETQGGLDFTISGATYSFECSDAPDTSAPYRWTFDNFADVNSLQDAMTSGATSATLVIRDGPG